MDGVVKLQRQCISLADFVKSRHINLIFYCLIVKQAAAELAHQIKCCHLLTAGLWCGVHGLARV